MATALPARVEEYTALQAQSTFTETEKKVFEELQKKITAHQKETALWYWELGKKVCSIHKDSKARSELYNNRVLERIAAGLGYKTPRQLYNAMKVVETFGTKQEFNEFLKLRGEAGNSLSWSHLVYLSSVSDKDDRLKIAAAALEQAWPADVLWDHIKQMTNKKPRGMRGPSAKIPTSVNAYLTHVTAQTEKFTFNCENSWSDEAFNIAEAIKETPTTKLNDKLLDSVKETRKRVAAMQKHATELANKLTSTEAEIEARIAAQKELSKKLAEEEAAAQEQEESKSPFERARKAKNKKNFRAGKKGPSRPGRVGV